MNKGLIMGAVFFALSSNASASLVEATQVTTKLRYASEHSHSSYGSSFAFDDSMQTICASIETEINVWRETYKKINQSDTPELFFDLENIKQLNDADLFIRSGEEMLRIQFEGLLNEHNENVHIDTIASIRKLRVLIAKLRMTITNVLQIEKQLHLAVATNKSTFDMSSEALQSMKVATENVYYH